VNKMARKKKRKRTSLQENENTVIEKFIKKMKKKMERACVVELTRKGYGADRDAENG